MLTEQQLTETALRIVAADLDRIDAYDRTEQIDKALCADCLPTDCARDAGDFGQEIRAVHQQIKDASAFLRVSLAQYAAARDITIPTA